MTKIGRLGLHLLISLHSPWVKLRRKWAICRGWPKDISNPCGFRLERFSSSKKAHVGETINAVFSFELLFIFLLIILFVTQKAVFSVFDTRALPYQVSNFQMVPEKNSLDWESRPGFHSVSHLLGGLGQDCSISGSPSHLLWNIWLHSKDSWSTIAYASTSFGQKHLLSTYCVPYTVWRPRDIKKAQQRK